jgi:hypothetical protein
MRFLRTLGFIAAGLLSHCAPVRMASPDVDRLTLTLQVTPQAGFAPLVVLAQVRALDPLAELLCPTFHLLAQLGDEPPDYASGFPGDAACGATPRIHAPRPRLIALRRPGLWEIRASMDDQGRALRTTQTVNVMGPE